MIIRAIRVIKGQEGGGAEGGEELEEGGRGGVKSPPLFILPFLPL